ncbi:MAG: membrane protein insertion efficiency factor YidD [bacterium]
MKQKIRKIFIKMINIYQKTLSPDTGILKNTGLIRKQVCVFYPTCSEYTKQAINKYGVLKGFKLGFFRIIRCHPWQKNHFDPLK